MKKIILFYSMLLFGCNNNHQTTSTPAPQPSPQTSEQSKNETDKKNDLKYDETPSVHAEQNDRPATTADDKLKTVATPPIIPPPFPSPQPTMSSPMGSQRAVVGRTGLLGEEGSIVPTLTYTAVDGARIQYYRAFIGGTLSTDEFARLLFQDPDFNRAVVVIGDLYRQDKLRGALSPEVEARFQELGQRVGAAVLVYNQHRRSAHYSNLAGGVIVGALVGATAGGLLMREEWVPELVKTKIGDRIPAYARDAMLGGTVGAGTVFVTMETYHIIDDLAHPEHVYNADPLLDGPVH